MRCFLNLSSSSAKWRPLIERAHTCNGADVQREVQQQTCTIAPLVSLEHPAYEPQGWCQQSRSRFTQGSALSDLPDTHTSLFIGLISSWPCLPLSSPPSFPRSPSVLSVGLGLPLVRPSFSTTVSLTSAPGMMQERKPSCSNHYPLTFISALSPWDTLQPSPAP